MRKSTKLRRSLTIAVLASGLALGTVGTGHADHIEFVSIDDNGGGWHTWHYWYHRSDPLTASTSTWGLTGTVGASWASGATYWDSGVVAGDGGSVEWTYQGGDDPQQGLYSTFDAVSNANLGSVPYEIDTDGDGSADYTDYIDGPVPEPATCALMIAGLAAVGARLRRKHT